MFIPQTRVLISPREICPISHRHREALPCIALMLCRSVVLESLVIRQIYFVIAVHHVLYSLRTCCLWEQIVRH